MHDVRKILIATDLTENSLAAIHSAMKIAEVNEAKVTVLHAFHVPSPGSNVMIDISDVVHNRVHSHMEALEAQLVKEHPTLEIETKVVMGQSALMIKKELQLHPADLLVIGTASKLNGVETHGTSSMVLNTGIATLIIPSEKRIFPKAISRVAIAVDVLDKNIKVQIKTALDWCESLTIEEVHFLHARKADEESTPDLKEYIELISPSPNLDVRLVVLSKGNPEHAIHAYIDQELIQLVFVFPRARNMINPLANESFTRSLVEGASNPVFIIP